jgi:predicted ATPase
MALSTLLLQPDELRPSIILLDEPERGLHPYAIAVLASVIKSISVESQVVLATQSATLLDQFDPTDVLIADRTDGSTRLRRPQ